MPRTVNARLSARAVPGVTPKSNANSIHAETVSQAVDMSLANRCTLKNKGGGNMEMHKGDITGAHGDAQGIQHMVMHTWGIQRRSGKGYTGAHEKKTRVVETWPCRHTWQDQGEQGRDAMEVLHFQLCITNQLQEEKGIDGERWRVKQRC
eukprot:1158664-Pelagomonas_calceolata.AAC.9